MKVLTVVDAKTSLSKMSNVGASMLPYDLCQELSNKSDIEMSLLVNNDLNIDKLSNVNIINLGEPPVRNYQKYLYNKLCEIINDYDIIHVHVSTPGFVKYLVSFDKEIQKKIIYTMHTWTRSAAVSFQNLEYFKKLVDDSEINIVCITKIQADELLKGVGSLKFYNEKRVHIIYNAVNEEIESFKYENKEDRIIAVGRLIESKGIDKIVKACIETNQKLLLVSPSWRMTPKEQAYSDYVKKLIDDSPEGLIDFRSSVPHQELIELIKLSKLGLLFSTFDVFSLFLLECIYKNTPVLAYNSGSTSEVCKILKDAGVTAFDNYKELVKLIRNYQEDSHKYEFTNDRIPEECKYDNFINNYYDLYRTIKE